MLIKGLGNIEEAVDLNLKLQDRLSLFTYPFRTKKEIETEINHIQNKDEKYENDCLLSFYDNDKFLGWVILFINQIEKYGKIDYLTLKEYNEKCIDDLIDYIEKSYAGYTFDFGIPMENKVMNEKMQKKGFKMIESCFDNRITLGKERYYRDNIELLKLEDFDEYAKHHDQSYGTDMYWNSRRIKANFNQFKILVMRENEVIKASVFMKVQGEHNFEIFGISESNDEKIMTILLKSTLSFLNENDELIYFTDIMNKTENIIIEKLNFKQYRSYLCLRKVFKI